MHVSTCPPWMGCQAQHTSAHVCLQLRQRIFEVSVPLCTQAAAWLLTACLPETVNLRDQAPLAT
jgi:hypothetical protein